MPSRRRARRVSCVVCVCVSVCLCLSVCVSVCAWHVGRVDAAMAQLESKLQSFENETANPLSEESEERTMSKSSSKDAAGSFETED